MEYKKIYISHILNWAKNNSNVLILSLLVCENQTLHIWGAIKGTGPRGVLAKSGASTSEEVAVGLQLGTRAEGIRIHAPKATTKVKILH